VLLSLLSGVMLLAFGLLRLGFLAHFLSHPVISGFITGSAVLIAVGQLKHLLGVKVRARTSCRPSPAWPTPCRKPSPPLALGGASVLFLWFARKYWPSCWCAQVWAPKRPTWLAKLAPMLVVIVSTAVVSLWGLDRSHGVSVVGAVPQGLPALGLPAWDWGSVQALWLPALLISLVGFVESVSVAQSLALKRQQRIDAQPRAAGPGRGQPGQRRCRVATRSPVALPARSSTLPRARRRRWLV
jgi:SulP family sulfate permease